MAFNARHFFLHSQFLKFTVLSCRRYNYISPKICFSMNRAYLRNDKKNDDLFVDLIIDEKQLNITKTIHFSRNMNESIDKFLKRFEQRVKDMFEYKAKKLKKKKNPTETIVDSFSDISNNLKASFTVNDKIVPDETLFKDLLNQNIDDLKLKILDKEYEVLYNYPVVSSIELPKKLKVGCPIYPVTFEAMSTSLEKCEILWYKQLPRSKVWEKCSEGFMYVPTEADVNSTIKVCCIPKNNGKVGPQIEAIALEPVEAFENSYCVKKRHLFTQNKTDKNEARVVTYNILADTYTNTKEAKSKLFTYCDPKILDINYRINLLTLELLGYNADIICLQEVNKKVFDKFLNPVLEQYQFYGVYNEKEGFKEGCVVFYNTLKFKIIKKHEYVIQKQLVTNPELSHIKDKIICNSELFERVTGLATLVQVVILESLTNNNIFVVANTHLYFHPDADHIRLLQGISAFTILMQKVKKLKIKNPSKTISIIFCGDFNSSPDCGIYKFMTEGFACSSLTDWRSKPNQEVNGVSFTNPIPMKSACGAPPFTNYTDSFKDCLDYIFYQSDSLELVQYVPLPSEEDLSKETAIPSSYFPSDHVALIADFKVKNI